jgi:hypothetical protein
VAFDDAAEILVSDRDWVVEGVEENGVRGFRTDAGKSQKARAQGCGGGGGKLLEGSGEFAVEQVDECLEGGGLAGMKAAGTNEFLEVGQAERTQAVNGERAGVAQVFKGALDRFPGGVLREVSAEDDFKRSFSGPPVLRTVCLGKAIVHPAETLGRGALHG